MTSEFAEGIDGRGRHVTGVSAGFDSGDTNLGVAPTGPVHQEHSFVGGFVELADNLLN